ncbi:MAG: MFS transporter [Actinomycetota bacterium]
MTTTPATVPADEASGVERSPRAILLAVAFAVFVAADDLTVVTTMLRPIVNDLGLVLPDGLDEAAWVVNAYLIAFVAAMPIAGRLSDVYGRRQVFVAAYALFLVGTILIPMSSTLGPFLVGRVLTALGGGAMVPVALAVVGDVYPEHKRARALGALAAIETLGWVWGPLYGAMLVRFFDWRMQFWLNIPLTLVGVAWVWWALAGHHRPDPGRRVDWVGAGLLTGALVSLDLALLGNAEVQSVTGLDQLRGDAGGSIDFRWLFLVAAGLSWAFVVHQRTHPDPVVERGLLRGRGIPTALVVNLLVGAALVVAMVDVPIFVNAVELDLERSAVVAGFLLSALTAGMAITSYVGGRMTERTSVRLPVLLGVAGVTVAYLWMGLTWAPDTGRVWLAAMLALLGCGLGLTVAPTTSAVVDAAHPDQRGSAAAAVMVVRLMGLSVGLAGLTAWALSRFNALRSSIELPPLDDPAFQAAVIDAQQTLTADAIGETFLATGVVAALALVFAWRLRPTSMSVSGLSSPEPASQREELPVLATIDQPRPVGAPTPPIGRPVLIGAGAAFAVVVIALVGALVWINRLASDLEDTQSAFAAVQADLNASETALATTQDDLARVEAGSALFASQVQGFADQIIELQPTVDEGLDDAIEGIDEFAASTLTFDVAVDETVEIATDVVIRRTVEVPINTEIPINQEFDTTITIDGPFGIDVPLDITVPIDVVVPVDVVVDIPIDETVPVNTEVPINVDVPIGIDISETELAELATSLSEGLRQLQEILRGIES